MAKKRYLPNVSFLLSSALSLMRPGLCYFHFQKKIGIENITTYVLLLEYLSIYLSNEGCFELLFEKLLQLLKVI